MSCPISFEEYIAVKELSHEWAASYDTKDWDRLRAIIAPELKVDYTTITGNKWDSLSADEFIGMISSEKVLGNKLVKSQHLLGEVKYRRPDPTWIEATYQIRAAHERLAQTGKIHVAGRSHSHGIIHHYYTQVEGKWKFGGLRVSKGWYEHSLGEKVYPFMHD